MTNDVEHKLEDVVLSLFNDPHGVSHESYRAIKDLLIAVNREDLLRSVVCFGDNRFAYL